MADDFNFQATVNINEKDISVYNLAAGLSTVTFKLSTASLDNLKNNLMFKLEDRKKEDVKIIKSFENFDEDSFREWDFLHNKYMYSFGGGTISYLKAIKSMESSTKASDKKEIDYAIELVKYINHNDNPEKKCYVSLGCGNGQKDKAIIVRTSSFSQYYPVDINCNLIIIAINEVQKAMRNGISSSCYIGDFTCLPRDLFSTGLFTNNIQKIFFCLGNTIGNYQENVLLDSLYRVMGDNDYAIIGFEKQTEAHIAKRYFSPENSDFILNPFKSIDTYSYVRPRYLRQSIVTGLSDIGSSIESYLFSLGSPNGSNLMPLHVIWSNRYNKESIINYFKGSSYFHLVECKSEDNDDVIVVLLNKKLKSEDKVQRAKEFLMGLKTDRMIEQHCNELLEKLNKDNNLGNKVDEILKLSENKKITKAQLRITIKAITKK